MFKHNYLRIGRFNGHLNPQVDEIFHQIELSHDPTYGRSYTPSLLEGILNGTDKTLKVFKDDLMECPIGINVKKWCEVGASGAIAVKKIKLNSSSKFGRISFIIRNFIQGRRLYYHDWTALL